MFSFFWQKNENIVENPENRKTIEAGNQEAWVNFYIRKVFTKKMFSVAQLRLSKAVYGVRACACKHPLSFNKQHGKEKVFTPK